MSGRKKGDDVVIDSDRKRSNSKKPTTALRPLMSSAGSNALNKSTFTIEDKITPSPGAACRPSVTASANKSKPPIRGSPSVEIPIIFPTTATWPRTISSTDYTSSPPAQKSSVIGSAPILALPVRVARTTNETKAAGRGSSDSLPSSLRSQVSNNSGHFRARSIPTKDPLGGSHWFKKAQRHDSDELFRIDDTSEIRKQKALMLTTGQGGTFGYGNRFQDEHGNLLTRDQSRSAQSRIKHLNCYGSGTRLIGTKGCVSCLGVYFEIAGNRVFCAHSECFDIKGSSWQLSHKRADLSALCD